MNSKLVRAIAVILFCALAGWVGGEIGMARKYEAACAKLGGKVMLSAETQKPVCVVGDKIVEVTK